jgi:phosphoglycerol transferase MdoB-like AlkP superfamily enzyme
MYSYEIKSLLEDIFAWVGLIVVIVVQLIRKKSEPSPEELLAKKRAMAIVFTVCTLASVFLIALIPAADGYSKALLILCLFGTIAAALDAGSNYLEIVFKSK